MVDVGAKVEKGDIEARADKNVKEGYKLFTILNVPLKVEKEIEENVIKVHYKKITVKPVDQIGRAHV